MEGFTPTSADATFDFHTLNLNQTPLYIKNANQTSGSNSVRNSNPSSDSHSNRTSLGLVNTSGYDPNFGYVSGHVTPESATASGAVTPFNGYSYDSRSHQISPSGAYNAVNGRDMGFNGVSRAPTSANHYGTLPHIAGQRGGHELEWPYSNLNSNDEYSSTELNSGNSTPPHTIKSEGDLFSLPIRDYYGNGCLQSKA